MKHHLLLAICLLALSIVPDINAQIIIRERPAEWDNLIFGGRFIDRFLPMPAMGTLTKVTWGAANVKPRYIENGIEDTNWSYWGGSFIG